MAVSSSPLQAAARLADDLQAVFGGRLRSVVVYGAHARAHLRVVTTSVQTAALVDHITYADLSACAERAGAWRKLALEMPLLLPVREFERSLDAFPLEYGDIIEHHILVYGTDGFGDQAVMQDDVRRACEVQARGHVIHLREGFLLAEHEPAAVAQLITASAGPFAALMEGFTKVTGGPRHATPELVAEHAERVAGLSATLIRQLLTIDEDGALDPQDALQLFPPYVDLMHALVTFVDGWRPTE